MNGYISIYPSDRVIKYIVNEKTIQTWTYNVLAGEFKYRYTVAIGVFYKNKILYVEFYDFNRGHTLIVVISNQIKRYEITTPKINYYVCESYVLYFSQHSVYKTDGISFVNLTRNIFPRKASFDNNYIYLLDEYNYRLKNNNIIIFNHYGNKIKSIKCLYQNFDEIKLINKYMIYKHINDNVHVYNIKSSQLICILSSTAETYIKCRITTLKKIKNTKYWNILRLINIL